LVHKEKNILLNSKSKVLVFLQHDQVILKENLDLFVLKLKHIQKKKFEIFTLILIKLIKSTFTGI